MSFLIELYNKKRIETADLLKGAAVILMIQVHLTEIYAVNEILESTVGKISLFLGGPPAAPLFMIIMGYFAVYKPRSSRQLFIRGVKLFGGGILLNLGMNFNLLISIFSGGYYYYIDPWRYIFGADILPLAGLSLIVISLIYNLFKNNYLLYLLLAIGFASIQPLLPDFGTAEIPWLMYVNAFLWGDFEWSYFPLIPWAAYPLTGAALFYLQTKFSYRNEKIKIIYLLLWTIFVILTIQYGVNTAADLHVYYHHNITYFFWIIIFLSGFAMLASVINKRYGSSFPVLYFKWIGLNVTAAYVIQWVLIGNIAPDVYKSQELQDLVFWFIGITAGVTLLVYLYSLYKQNKATNVKRVRVVR